MTNADMIEDIMQFYSHYSNPSSLAEIEWLGVGIDWELLKEIEGATLQGWDRDEDYISELYDDVMQCVEDIRHATKCRIYKTQFKIGGFIE